MESVYIILAIMFWVVCALGIVCLIACTFVYVDNHRENKRQEIADEIYNAVMDETVELVEKIISENSENNT